MDSRFNYTHYTNLSLPILDEGWMDEQKHVVSVDLPGGTELPEDHEFSIEAITKFTLKDTKKNKKNADDVNAGGRNGAEGGGNGGNDKDPKLKPNLLEI